MLRSATRSHASFHLIHDVDASLGVDSRLRQAFLDEANSARKQASPSQQGSRTALSNQVHVQNLVSRLRMGEGARGDRHRTNLDMDGGTALGHVHGSRYGVRLDAAGFDVRLCSNIFAGSGGLAVADSDPAAIGAPHLVVAYTRQILRAIANLPSHGVSLDHFISLLPGWYSSPATPSGTHSDGRALTQLFALLDQLVRRCKRPTATTSSPSDAQGVATPNGATGSNDDDWVVPVLPFDETPPVDGESHASQGKVVLKARFLNVLRRVIWMSPDDGLDAASLQQLIAVHFVGTIASPSSRDGSGSTPPPAAAGMPSGDDDGMLRGVGFSSIQEALRQLPEWYYVAGGRVFFCPWESLLLNISRRLPREGVSLSRFEQYCLHECPGWATAAFFSGTSRHIVDHCIELQPAFNELFFVRPSRDDINQLIIRPRTPLETGPEYQNPRRQGDGAAAKGSSSLTIPSDADAMASSSRSSSVDHALWRAMCVTSRPLEGVSTERDFQALSMVAGQGDAQASEDAAKVPQHFSVGRPVTLWDDVKRLLPLFINRHAIGDDMAADGKSHTVPIASWLDNPETLGVPQWADVLLFGVRRSFEVETRIAVREPLIVLRDSVVVIVDGSKLTSPAAVQRVLMNEEGQPALLSVPRLAVRKQIVVRHRHDPTHMTTSTSAAAAPSASGGGEPQHHVIDERLTETVAPSWLDLEHVVAAQLATIFSDVSGSSQPSSNVVRPAAVREDFNSVSQVIVVTGDADAARFVSMIRDTLSTNRDASHPIAVVVATATQVITVA